MIPDHASRLEDVRFMATTGENLTGAARRLHISRQALEKWLDRHDPASSAQLRAREPRDHNTRTAGRNQHTAA